ncbi:MAG: hypothetical protein LLG37_03420 [Spirochaetia bacterium]|nr:hypothetical protein [Spirochaetia bacterium]
MLNTKRSYSAVIAGTGYKAVKIRPDKYYGFTVADSGGEKVRVSDRERTPVDLIYNPIGSFRDVREVIRENMEKIDC